MPWQDSLPGPTDPEEVHIYRDQPKPGETDAGWCGYASRGGHVTRCTTGHATEADARAALQPRRKLGVAY